MKQRDTFDPRIAFKEERECRIWGDDREGIHAEVDEIDYQWALQWLWSPKWSRGGKKVYLRRNIQTTIIPAYKTQDGHKMRFLQNKTLFLHVAIMERMGKEKPTPAHILVDHRDGNGLNCKRSNLRWATHEMNCRNKNGKFGFELGEF